MSDDADVEPTYSMEVELYVRRRGRGPHVSLTLVLNDEGKVVEHESVESLSDTSVRRTLEVSRGLVDIMVNELARRCLLRLGADLEETPSSDIGRLRQQWAESKIGQRVTVAYSGVIDEQIEGVREGSRGTGIWCKTKSGEVFKPYPPELQ